ncbi:MAG: hypothetical protein KDD94_11010 [Calditrichaeota bacterium]|nr:hypothetical protein [Calditrichota bacterium]
MQKVIHVLLCTILFLISSCASSSGNNQTKTSEEKSIEKTNEGASQLSNGDLSAAIDSFTEAIKLDSTNVSAYAGLGWSYILFDSVDNALAILVAGNNLNPENVEILSGLAFVYNSFGDTNSLQLSNQYIESLLNVDSDWISSYGYDFAINDIYIVLAQNHYILGNYAASLAAIQHVDALFQVDITGDEGRSQLSDKIESYNSGITKK